jgi:hypothetical protein
VTNLVKDVERGQRAATLLRDPALTDAFEGVASAIHERWAATPVRDREGAHELHLMLKLLNDLKSVLETAVTEGNHALKEIEFQKTSNKVLSPAQWSGR